MRPSNWRWRVSTALAVATAALGPFLVPARADFGFGFGAFNWVPQPGEFINSHSLLNAAHATRGPVQRNVYANNPNAYVNRVRDPGFTQHFGLDTRRSLYDVPVRRTTSTASRNPAPTPAATPAPAPAPRPAPTASAAPAVPRPIVPIGSFFNAMRQLVWPNDAPVDGDLQGKRDTSDATSLVVRDLVEMHGSAPITTVSDARQKLIAYGQPALQHLRTHATPRVSDTFHLFLLSLYESLAQAANPPEVALATPPAR